MSGFFTIVFLRTDIGPYPQSRKRRINVWIWGYNISLMYKRVLLFKGKQRANGLILTQCIICIV